LPLTPRMSRTSRWLVGSEPTSSRSNYFTRELAVRSALTRGPGWMRPSALRSGSGPRRSVAFRRSTGWRLRVLPRPCLDLAAAPDPKACDLLRLGEVRATGVPGGRRRGDPKDLGEVAEAYLVRRHPNERTGEGGQKLRATLSLRLGVIVSLSVLGTERSP